ncbi:hypothetical protein ACFWOJ_19385 [Streptomyces sp. NPDC058439]|uniref:hypothetical protein n=1 Tax=Streptomyces sp. NPDC058439 TaxID=3346500 RepID=UPI00365E9A1A
MGSFDPGMFLHIRAPPRRAVVAAQSGRILSQQQQEGPAGGQHLQVRSAYLRLSALWQREPLFDEQGFLRARSVIAVWWGQAADGLLSIGESAMPSVLGLMERREARARQDPESWTEGLEQAQA